MLECVRLDADDAAIALSPVMAETLVAARARPGGCAHVPTLALVRRQRPYALLGPRDLRLPRLGEGVAFLERRGLPVYRRVGGGSLVVLDEDCLSFALAWPCANPGHAGAAVRLLAEPIIACLAALGAKAHLGAAAGSYCEGPSDVVLDDGRKVAGMSLALRGGWALLSGMLLVRQDPAYATGIVAGFEAASGGARQYLSAAVTRLDAALGRPLDPEATAEALLRAMAAWAGADAAGFRTRAPSGREREVARALLPERRLRSATLDAQATAGRR